MHDRELASRLDRIEGQLAIQQLAARFARGVDSRDIDAIVSLFSPTADFGRFGIEEKGQPGARALFGAEETLAHFYRSMHQICGHVIELDGSDHADGTVYCRVDSEDGDHWIVQLMIYFDRYRRVDGRWYIEERQFTYLHTGEQGVNPQDASFNDWPGWAGSDALFAPSLPNRWPSWESYWQDRPQLAAKRTRRP